ncbi:hypothetical protein BDF20DRAFT_810443, partial [Mycotypha africana]|uniref:uncharacterized protein n=1 Tax=Mycotypha africana TaxID=64632 RepID=UPI0023002E67
SNIMKGTTDFRRRKNWTERILVEMAGLLHVLSTTGKFLYCSESTFELTGYRPHELVGQAILDFLHVDDMDVFIRDFQMSFYTRSKIRTYYRFRKKDDTYVIFEVVGQPQRTDPSQQQQQQHQQQEQQQQQQQQHQAPTSFFAIAQPVPTKSGGLMDTFLELKAENIWLRERIEELKQQQSTKYHKSNGDSGVNNQVVTESIDDNEELQQQQQQQLEVGATPLNMIAPIDPCKTTDSIKLNRLFRGKKQKGPDEYVCADCGTTSSPEWRKGPHGPKSLCNACGLRWAKRNKQ